MSETMQQRAPRPNDDAWALAIGLGVVGLALFGLAGAAAVEGVLGGKGGISRLRGVWQPLDGRWCLPVFHPSYLLRNPSRQEGSPKWLTWQDMQDVKRRLQQLEEPSP